MTDMEFIPRGTTYYEWTRLHLAVRLCGFSLRWAVRDAVLGAVVR